MWLIAIMFLQPNTPMESLCSLPSLFSKYAQCSKCPITPNNYSPAYLAYPYRLSKLPDENFGKRIQSPTPEKSCKISVYALVDMSGLGDIAFPSSSFNTGEAVDSNKLERFVQDWASPTLPMTNILTSLYRQHPGFAMHEIKQ